MDPAFSTGGRVNPDIAGRFGGARTAGRIVCATLAIALCLAWLLVCANPAHGAPDLGAGLVANYPFGGDANDASGNGHHGVVDGATFAADRFGNPSSALSLDGVDDFVQVPHHSDLNVNPTGFTVALWTKASPSQLSFDSHFNLIDKSHGDGNQGWTVQGRIDPPFDGLAFVVCYEGSIACDPGTGAGVDEARVLDDRWHCMVGTFDPPAINFFLDGNLEDDNAATGTPGPNELDLFMGRWFPGFRHFHGLMDDVRLYRRALTAAEIRAFCEVNSPPDCSTVSASPGRLWPPNHKLRLVRLGGATDPDGDAVVLTITAVTQDEALNGLGDGDTSPDANAGTHSNSARLRAERSGKGDGRVYRVSFAGSDGEGGSCSGTIKVGVPRSIGAGSTPIDSAPPSFDSLGP
jgi:hypothetical protein